MTDKTTLATEADRALALASRVRHDCTPAHLASGAATLIERMQHTINELHNALWIAIQDAGGEIAVTADEQRAMPPPGRIEWLRSMDQAVLVIRAGEGVQCANANPKPPTCSSRWQHAATQPATSQECA